MFHYAFSIGAQEEASMLYGEMLRRNRARGYGGAAAATMFFPVQPPVDATTAVLRDDTDEWAREAQRTLNRLGVHLPNEMVDALRNLPGASLDHWRRLRQAQRAGRF